MMKRFIKTVSLVLVLLQLSAPAAFAFGFINVKYTDNNTDFAVETAEVIEKFDSRNGNTAPDSVGSKLRIIGKTTNADFNFSSLDAKECIVNSDGRFVLQFSDDAKLKKCLTKLNGMSDILYAEQDATIYTSSLSQEDADGNLSWGAGALGLDDYSDYIASSHSESSVTVAIVDSGVEKIDYLKDRLVGGYDFVDNDSDGANDESVDSHGTFMASIVADCTQDASVKIMPVRVLESKTGSLINAINGIYYAADNGADVINVSLCGVLSNCKSLDNAVSYSDSKGVCVVACAGNLKRDTADCCPAHNENAITVSSLDEELVFASSFSNYGSAVDVCAPGVYVTGYVADGTLKMQNGTSLSAAFISAGTALLRLQYPGLDTSRIQSMMKDSCLDLGDEGFDIYYGFGIPQFDKFITDTTVYVESLTVTEETVTLEIDDSVTVIPVIYPENATDKSVIWKSENEGIASVDETGSVTAKSIGETVIHAEANDGGFSDSFRVIVVEPEAPPVIIGISVAEKPSKQTYIYKSEGIDLTGVELTVNYSDGSSVTVTDTSKIGVRNFDTASVGEKTVTLEYEGFEAQIEITVEYAWWQWIIRILLLGFLWY